MIKETEFQRMVRKTGHKPVNCKCKECKRQCEKVSCLGTPADIEKIVDAGFKDRIAPTEWIVPALYPDPITMYQPKYDRYGCTFFKEGLCTLHDLGLKPTEGRLSHHSTIDVRKNTSISRAVARSWCDTTNTEIMQRLVEKMNVKEETS